MKTLNITEYDVNVDCNFWTEILRKAGVKSFNLRASGKDCQVNLHVNLEKVLTYSKGEAKAPETVAGVSNILIIL